MGEEIREIPKFDSGYKQELAKKEQFIHFMQKYVKAEWCRGLTPDQVTLCDREFVLEDYQKRQADLVYCIHLGKREIYVYLIMELQSKVDFTMPFRLLTLMYAFWLKVFLETPEKERKRKNFRLPVVVPILFYNGSNRWTAETEFRRYLNENELFADYVPNFKYYLVDLSQITNEYILNSNTLIDNIMALDKNRKSNKLTAMLDIVARRMKQLGKEDQVEFRKWLEFILSAACRGSSRESIEQLIEAMQKGDAQVIHGLQKTIMEEYDAGMKAGREAGREIGKRVGLAEGRRAGLAEGKQAGLEEGRRAGLAEGKQAGLEEGRRAGLAEGRRAGLVEGKQAGLAEGRKLGMEAAIEALVKDYMEEDFPREKIISKLQKHFKLDEESAVAYYEKYK